jgi:CRISPR-associated protein Csd2
MNRIDFSLLFDVTDGNPNGNPDAGNMPRQDAETGQGLVTDVCVKRKLRNYVETTRGSEPGYAIHVRERAILNVHQEDAFKALGLDITAKESQASTDSGRAKMCQTFYDVRTFGAVMTTGTKGTRANCGQVRGPVQLTFGRSIDLIVVDDHCITRVAVASQEEADSQSGENRTMGRKYTVPYALYRMNGFINPFLAKQTGFSDADLALFWEALKNGFELDRSAGRGLMGCKGLMLWEHANELGNAPAYKLFESVKIVKQTDVPRSFGDYKVTVGDAPEGVTVTDSLQLGV